MAQVFDFSALEAGMSKTIDNLRSEFSGLRTSRATVSLLDHVVVSAYGRTSAVAQLASISLSDARTLVVHVWDKSLVTAVEKAILASDLGLNPATHGDTIRLSMPPLTHERRKELVRIAGRYAESARVAIRNIRHNGLSSLKRSEKEANLGKDDVKDLANKIQCITDQFIEKVEDMLREKEREIQF